MWMGDRYGRMPDLIGLAEIENRGVLTKLLRTTVLRKHDYGIVHHDSGDRRGIDVAILYRKSVMRLESESLKTPEMDGQKLATRDILHARMCLADSSSLDFIVNHHPSKYGGEKESEGRRGAAMTALKELCDSIGSGNVIAMGDFNDTPDSSPFSIIDTVLVNKAGPLHEKGEGTIRYEGKWDLIDMFLVSPRLDSCTRMEISRIPFLMKWERKHPGWKPFRTYSGPRYIGGVSDHCPVVLTILLTY
jgi:endonuclease/exonuclease/phosphatase family metal-dependent hydrolase